MPGLLFIGSACADVVVRLPHLPAASGDDLHITSQRVSLGGCACNAFLTARRASQVPCTLFAPVGSGVWGEWIARAFAERGIVSPIPRPGEPNGCCYCLVEESGERTFLSEHGAEYRFRPEWFALTDLSAFDGVYICGLEIEESTGGVIIDALEQHPPKRLYFAPGPRITRIPRERLERLYALRPVLHLNEQEAAAATGCADSASAAKALSAMTGNDVIITLGGEGAYFRAADDEGLVPGTAARVENTIGAGDSHIGAVMAREAAGETLREAVGFANRVSAAVVGVPGTELPDEVWQSLTRAQPSPASL